MSQAPRNPFQSGPDQFQQPQQSGTSTWVWVLGIIGGVFLIGVIACCGFGVFVWFQTSEFVAGAAAEEYADDPVVIEKIGNITEANMSFSEVIEESSKDEDISAFVLQVKGDKGSGKIIQRTNIQTNEVTVTLVMENGEEFELEVPDMYADFEEEMLIEEPSMPEDLQPTTQP